MCEYCSRAGPAYSFVLVGIQAKDLCSVLGLMSLRCSGKVEDFPFQLFQYIMRSKYIIICGFDETLEFCMILLDQIE